MENLILSIFCHYQNFDSSTPVSTSILYSRNIQENTKKFIIL